MITEGGEGGEGGDAGAGATGGEGGDAGNKGNEGGGEAITWEQVHSAIPEELRSDKSMETITSLEGLTKSYIHAQKALGKDKFIVPDKHASPEDWQQIFQKLGNPEKLEDYKVNVADEKTAEDEGFLKFKEAAHKAGVLPHQFEQLVETLDTQGKSASEKRAVEQKAEFDKQINALKTEWGDQYDNQVKKANAAFKHLIPEAADRKAFLATGMGDHPYVAKLLASASKFMSEDDFVGTGDGSLGGLTPTEALKKAQEIQGNMEHPYRKPEHPGHKAAKKEVADLYASAFPE